MDTDGTIEDWLAACGLQHLAEAFQNNGIEIDILPELTAADLAEMGLSLGDRKRVLKALAAQFVQPDKERIVVVQTASREVEVKASPAERRQITVLFCDLVGSSQLLGRLDPEVSRNIIRNYRTVIAAEVDRLGGHVAQFLGDGILAYFGWPVAYEDAAKRAVTAACNMVNAVATLLTPEGEHLAIRIGIATGLVVVGGDDNKSIAEDLTAVGGAVNVAARLQDHAKAGQILVARSTQQLVNNFSFSSEGPRTLKGIAEAVETFLVVGEQRAPGKARRGHALAMQGREEELNLAVSRWRKVSSGAGQVLLITGEPGIGKSHMTERLVLAFEAEGANTKRFVCSPFQQSTALHPVLENLRLAMAQVQGEAPEISTEKLRHYLGQFDIDLAAAMPCLLKLLSISSPLWEEPDGTTPMIRKARSFAALNSIFHAQVLRKPLLLVLEDAHWVDPTTLEYFEQLIASARNLPVLVLINARPEFRLPQIDFGNVTSIALQKMVRSEIEKIIASISGTIELPADVVASIVERSDGVPLFVEELTKAVLESGLNMKEMNAEIPSSLRDTLMARLDRIPQAREIAQIAACIGRECDHDLLAALSGREGSALNEALERLAKAEILFRQGQEPRMSYRFKHALVQETAADSLLKSKRRSIHLQIANYLEDTRKDYSAIHPELLAHHFTKAEAFEAAINYREKAGQLALAASGNHEAINEFANALELITLLPPSSARDNLELSILIAQAIPYTLTRGYAAPEVEAVYKRAMETSSRLPEVAQNFAVIYGFWRFYLLRGDYANAMQLSEQLLRIAGGGTDFAGNVTSNRAAGSTRFYMARYKDCLKHLGVTSDIAPEDKLRRAILSYDVVDPWVVNHAYSGMALWINGKPTEAIQYSEKAIDLAREVNHPFTLALALCFAQWTYQFGGHHARVKSLAEEALVLANKHSFTFWTGWAEMLLAWADRNADRSDVKQRMKTALQLWQSTGSQLGLSYFQCLLAEQSDGAEAKLLLDAAEKFASEREELFWMPEIHRLRGLHILNEGYADATLKAGEHFRVALSWVDKLDAQGLGLRAALDQASLLKSNQDQRIQYIKDILKPRVAKFAEQDDFADLQKARQIINSTAPG